MDQVKENLQPVAIPLTYKTVLAAFNRNKFTTYFTSNDQKYITVSIERHFDLSEKQAGDMAHLIGVTIERHYGPSKRPAGADRATLRAAARLVAKMSATMESFEGKSLDDLADELRILKAEADQFDK